MHRAILRCLTPALTVASLAFVAACDDDPLPTEVEPESAELVEGEDDASFGYRPKPTRSQTTVFAYPDGIEPLGTSTLVRRHSSLRYRIRTTGLTPGHAYTVWMVIFNHPWGCAADDGEPICNDFDLFNPEAKPDLLWAAGRRAGKSGNVTFTGRRNAWNTIGSVNEPLGLPSYGLVNPMGADVRFIVHDHGPVIRELMPDMVRSIDGGCTDAGVPVAGFESPWNLYDGQPKLPGYGRRGPNTCQSIQFAAHIPGT